MLRNWGCHIFLAFRRIPRLQRGPDTPTLLPFPQVAVELYELLNFLAAEKTQRVQSINKTRESRTMLLEFCVDTQDPNAHKHEQILSELNGAFPSLGILPASKASFWRHWRRDSILQSTCPAGLILTAPLPASRRSVKWFGQVARMVAACPELLSLIPREGAPVVWQNRHTQREILGVRRGKSP